MPRLLARVVCRLRGHRFGPPVPCWWTGKRYEAVPDWWGRSVPEEEHRSLCTRCGKSREPGR